MEQKQGTCEPKEIDLVLGSGFFKALSEPIRCELLRFLAIQGPSDILTVANAFPQDRSVISRHLKLLQDTGLLKSTRVSRHVYYEIDGPSILANLDRLVGQVRLVVERCCKG